ncbi:hypothetical protein MCOR29_010507 [Pyricularia oryzae]|nr:hypothetical protein MCOR29_010507 [Pyricularia oryzae]KAI6354434.1 hypothetical protein MCOR32_010542 [Pyricularia oryzae]KAI6389623.1 hypothetical protein MCOR23_010021 [Pyricularia oryzae]KAI6563739.1 hypothetical protein MCOR09_007359 [Pyricularia oryzae]
MVKIEYVPTKAGQDPPEVVSIASDERWSLVTTIDHEEIVKESELSLGGSAAHKTGVPDSVRVAVLVRRETDDPFNAMVTIEAEADMATNFGSLFRKVPLENPVLFNPKAERKGSKKNEGRSRGVENLGAEPLYSYCKARVVGRRVCFEDLI